MREGWTYKKLDDCCEIEYGTRVVQKKDGGTIYPVYGGGGETFRMDKYNREDCMIVARFAMSPKCVRYVPGKFFLNDSGLSVKAGDDLVQKYLNHHILYYNDEIYHLGKGAAQRNLDVKSFRQLIISIPPKSQQEAIVSELDEINSLLALKREQLQKYDKLAQSLFYEMFGDPVENEKGWEVKKLGELCPVSSFKRVLVEDVLENGPVPFIRGTELSAMCKEGKSDFKMFITMEHYEKVKSISGVPKVGDLLIPSINSEGLVWVVNTLEPMYYKDGRVLWVHIDSDEISSIDLQKILNNLLRDNYSKITNGAVFAELNLSVLRSFPVILPPLSLQQQFASRIEQIESQKQQVQAAIEKLETLLASRMQYWFE